MLKAHRAALTDLLRSAAAAAAAADPGEGLENDGGTCNLDSARFNIKGARADVIQVCAIAAGVPVERMTDDWWLCVAKGQAARRTRMAEAAGAVLQRGAHAIPGMRAWVRYCID